MTTTRLAGWQALFLAAIGCGATTEEAPVGAATARCDGEVAIGDSGYFVCDGVFTHRVSKGTCSSSLPRATLPDDASTSMAVCNSDAECTALPHGYCGPQPYAFTGTARQCAYGCVRDEECSAGMICLCGDPVGRCVDATCTVDADCGAGLLCVGTTNPGPCSLTSTTFACETPADECLSPADCSTGTHCNPGQARTCGGPTAVCGRPFLIDGAARLAPLVSGDGWSGAPGRCAALPGHVRDALARHYARVALMEHASVAAFARFSLELLALGAPSALVHEAQLALGDEIRHAGSCFALASSYAGRALAPGLLELDGALSQRDLSTIVGTAVREACIGESLAAIEADEAARCATVPEVRALLAGIAADEARHAELGWRFVRWLLDSASPQTRVTIERAVEQALLLEPAPADPGPAQDGATEAALQAHGVLPAARAVALREAALHEVIGPVARALLEPARRAA